MHAHVGANAGTGRLLLLVLRAHLLDFERLVSLPLLFLCLLCEVHLLLIELHERCAQSLLEAAGAVSCAWALVATTGLATIRRVLPVQPASVCMGVLVQRA